MTARSRIPFDDTKHESASLTGLVSGILDDAQRLAGQQFAMLKAELKEDFDRTQRAARYGGIGIVMLTVGGLTLVAFLVNLLHEQIQFSMWASCLIMGGLMTGIGLAFAAAAGSLIMTFNPLPNKTIDTLQENLTWQTQPQA